MLVTLYVDFTKSKPPIVQNLQNCKFCTFSPILQILQILQILRFLHFTMTIIVKVGPILVQAKLIFFEL